MPDAPGLELIRGEIEQDHPGAVLDTGFEHERAVLVIDPAQNLAVLRWPRVTLGGRELLLFDVFGTLATIAVAFTALRSTAQVAKRLYDLERIN